MHDEDAPASLPLNFDSPVFLPDLVDQIQMGCDEWCSYIHRRTAELVGVSAEAFHGSYFADEEEELVARIEESEDFIPIPKSREVDTWRLMLKFATLRQNQGHLESLEAAIRKKGAYRRFKDMVIDMGIQNEWYAFEKEAFEKFAESWLDSNCIAWTRQRPSG